MSHSSRFLDALLRVMETYRHAEVRRVLVIGPGTSDPIALLAEEFPSAQFTLLDKDPMVVKQLSQGINAAIERVAVVAGDASNPQDLPLDRYDLVIARHPDIARFRTKWGIALSACIDRLAPRGIAGISTYSLLEVAYVSQILADQPVDVLPDAPYTAKPVPMRGDDRYLIMAQKRA